VRWIVLRGRVGVHLRSRKKCQFLFRRERRRVADLALATGQCDVDEAAGVCEPLLRATLTVRFVSIWYWWVIPTLWEEERVPPVGGWRTERGRETYGVFFFSCLSTLGVCDLTFPVQSDMDQNIFVSRLRGDIHLMDKRYRRFWDLRKGDRGDIPARAKLRGSQNVSGRDQRVKMRFCSISIVPSVNLAHFRLSRGVSRFMWLEYW